MSLIELIKKYSVCASSVQLGGQAELRSNHKAFVN